MCVSSNWCVRHHTFSPLNLKLPCMFTLTPSLSLFKAPLECDKRGESQLFAKCICSASIRMHTICTLLTVLWHKTQFVLLSLLLPYDIKPKVFTLSLLLTTWHKTLPILSCRTYKHWYPIQTCKKFSIIFMTERGYRAFIKLSLTSPKHLCWRELGRMRLANSFFIKSPSRHKKPWLFLFWQSKV